MIYALRHRTTYGYEHTVRFARCVLRLTPGSSAAQTVLNSGIKVTPRPSEKHERVGPFGERTVTVIIDKPHDALVIESRSRIDVHAPEAPASGGAPWEDVRRQALIVFSDGEDTSSLVSFEEVLELAKRSETAIYTIALRGNEANSRGFREAEFVMRQLAQETGGRGFFPAKVDDLNGVYGQIAD
ncbi:MAG: transglutaminase N-terminal domain-containing protein, partial [Dehalococcoidia bacterium]|nr:transglutaminase N-terminal domain-containing protein [Dehalococcoidia bacterium]